MSHEITQVYTASTGVVTLDSSGTLRYSMLTPADDNVTLVQMVVQSTAEQIGLELYEDVTSNTGGVIQVPVNRDRQSTKIFPGELQVGVVSRVGGVLLIGTALLGTKSKEAVVSSSSEFLDLRLKKGCLYHMEVVNLTSGAKDIEVTWDVGTNQGNLGA